MSEYTLSYEDWNSSDGALIAKMKGIKRALKNHKVDAASILYESQLGGTSAATHIFGDDGYHFCAPELVVTWLSLLVRLASSKGITGQSMASRFIKGCGACMVYTILMVVACFPDKKITRLAFDFFRRVLGDSKGHIFELNEIDQIALLLNQQMRGPEERTLMRCCCLRISNIASYADKTTSKGQTAVQLSDIIEGLGALCTSMSFASEMRANSASITKVLQEHIQNKTFSEKFVRTRWP